MLFYNGCCAGDLAEKGAVQSKIRMQLQLQLMSNVKHSGLTGAQLVPMTQQPMRLTSLMQMTPPILEGGTKLEKLCEVQQPTRQKLSQTKMKLQLQPCPLLPCHRNLQQIRMGGN